MRRSYGNCGYVVFHNYHINFSLKVALLLNCYLSSSLPNESSLLFLPSNTTAISYSFPALLNNSHFLLSSCPPIQLPFPTLFLPSYTTTISYSLPALLYNSHFILFSCPLIQQPFHTLFLPSYTTAISYSFPALIYNNHFLLFLLSSCLPIQQPSTTLSLSPLIQQPLLFASIITLMGKRICT